MRIGEIDIPPLADGTFRASPQYFGEHVTAEGHEDLFIRHQQAWLPIGCFLVRTGSRTVLIDAGIGPGLRDAGPRRVVRRRPPADVPPGPDLVRGRGLGSLRAQPGRLDVRPHPPGPDRRRRRRGPPAPGDRGPTGRPRGRPDHDPRAHPRPPVGSDLLPRAASPAPRGRDHLPGPAGRAVLASDGRRGSGPGPPGPGPAVRRAGGSQHAWRRRALPPAPVWPGPGRPGPPLDHGRMRTLRVRAWTSWCTAA